MKISTETYPLDGSLGYVGAVEALAKIGFDYYDFSMFGMSVKGDPINGDNYREAALEIRRAADRVGIRCNQSHAPFPFVKPGNDEWNKNIFDWLVRALEITSILGGKNCIMHPWKPWTAQENAERIFLPLTPYAKKYGVKIAIENMFLPNPETGRMVPCCCSTAASFLEHLSLLDPEWCVACLDIGHAELLGDCVSAVEMIHALGDRLQALHVQDNDHIGDLHIIPYLGQIEWEKVCKALKEVGYRGEFTFEAHQFVKKFPKEMEIPATRFMYELGRCMTSRFF